MYKIFSSSAYKKSLVKLVRSGKFSRREADRVVGILASGEKLPASHRDHALQGNMAEFRECHIRGDVLLIYKIQNKELILILADIGSHSYLFE
jgi:mRNA interferase YafQ